MGILLSLLLGLVQSVDFTTNSTSLQKSFKLINYHIYDNVENDAPEENIQEAERWYNLTASRSEDPDLINALELFIELPVVVDKAEHRCTPYSYRVLSMNEIATNYRSIHAFEEDFAPRRIDEIVHFYCSKHAKYCHETVLNVTSSRHQSLNNVTVARAEAMALSWRNRPTKNITREVYRDYKYVDLVETVEAPGARSKCIFNTIARLSSGDSESKFLKKVVNKREGSKVLRRDKIKSLIHKYLVQPCKLYITTLDLDKATIEFTDRWYQHDCEKYRKFKCSYKNYEACEDFVETMEKNDVLYDENYDMIDRGVEPGKTNLKQ